MEAATTETLIFLVELVNQSLEETKEFREPSQVQPRILSMVEAGGEYPLDLSAEDIPDSPTSVDAVDKANEDYRKLITLHTRIMLLSDVFTTSGYQGRATASLLQALTARNATNVLPELGALHRACTWVNVLVKSHPVFGSVDVTPIPDLLQALESRLTPSPSRQDDAPAGNSANGASGSDAPGASSSAGTSSTLGEPKKEDGPKEQNAKALKHLSTQIPSTLSSFFQGKYVRTQDECRN